MSEMRKNRLFANWLTRLKSLPALSPSVVVAGEVVLAEDAS